MDFFDKSCQKLCQRYIKNIVDSIFYPDTVNNYQGKCISTSTPCPKISGTPADKLV